MTEADRAGFDRLYRAEAEALLRRTRRRITADATLVEDACATAWAILATRPDVLHDERAPRWLAVVAYHEGLRLLGREVPVAELPEVAHERDLAAQIDARDTLRRITALAPRQRESLTLLAYGFSYEQIAAQTGRSRGAVNKALFKGRRQLARPAVSTRSERKVVNKTRERAKPAFTPREAKLLLPPKAKPTIDELPTGSLARVVLEIDREIERLQSARKALIKGARAARR